VASGIDDGAYPNPFAEPVWQPRRVEDRLAALDEESGDVLVLALRLFVYRDLTDSAQHMMEEPDWMPVTVEYALRLRRLNQRHGLWDGEPDLVRLVLDGCAPGA
jgi:hypothetical protein